MFDLKRIFGLLFAFTLLLLSACNDYVQRDNSQNGADNTATMQTVSSEAVVVDIPPAPTFKYEELSVPHELKEADYLYFCYSDDNQIIVSVGAKREKEWGERSNVTKYICVCDSELQVEKTYSISLTDTDIISAVPYKEGIAYACFEDEFSNGEYNCTWQIVYTDGENDEVLDSGMCSYYDFTPSLFILENELCYLYGERLPDSRGFVVKRIKDGDVETIIENNDARLCSAFAKSNGDNFCLLADYPGREFATFLICDSAGIIYEHDLNAKITSHSINDIYAICGTGDEQADEFFAELVCLVNGEGKLLKFPYGSPLYCMTANADSIICVNNSWKPYYIDVPNERFISMPLPLTVGDFVPIDFVPISDTEYLLAAMKTKYSEDGTGYDTDYELYRLTVIK